MPSAIPSEESDAELEREAQSAPSIYEKYFEFSPDAIVVTDQDGCICQINPQCLQLFGYLSDEMIGQKIEILVPERFR